MPTATIITASAQPRAGRSTVAAALAYRYARDGKTVTLARLSGDESATADAAAFAAVEGVVSPGAPVTEADVAALTGDVVVLEAPAGPVRQLADALKARVVAVGAAPTDAAPASLAGTIVARATPGEQAPAGVLATFPEDRMLAAPSAGDIAAAIKGRWLVEGERASIARVMIGTISSDAASPYFANRERTCVITRYDKTDVQLAALLTDLELLVLTGGGEPSPYLIDRVAHRDDVSVFLAHDDTVDVMRQIEPLYAASRFEGAGKLARAVELLDAAGVDIAL